MKRPIKKIAILGSGVMGSQIACHFANAGVEVLLLDMVPRELSETEQKRGLTLTDKSVRNRIADSSLLAAIKSKPAPLYLKEFQSRITTGNFDDDLAKIADYDWVMEVIIENLAIKQGLFEKVDAVRTPGTLISTNTSGIPIHLLTEGRSADFQAHFCGTHFFNPPRYLALLEIIPTAQTSEEVIDFLMEYGSKHLGKSTVLCQDTPAFIANRIGVYSIMALFHLVKKMGLSVDEVDKLTGPVMGRPKSATFRTCDVVGLDTLVRVAEGLAANCPEDEARELFQIPDYVRKMVDNKWLGSKSGQGFYKKQKGKDGKSEIHSLNLETLEYAPKSKARFATLELTKTVDDLAERTRILFQGKDNAGEFYRALFMGQFAYVSHRIPEITDQLFKVDAALKAGFGYELGPFETWDALNIQEVLPQMEAAGHTPAKWVYDMLEKGHTQFYKIEDGIRYFYDIPSQSYLPIPGNESLVILENLRNKNTLWQNPGASIIDLGDGIINLEFHSKMNTIGSDVIHALNKAIDLAEAEYKGLVIYNTGSNFSAGANVGMIFMMAIEQEYEELDYAIKTFQNTVMRMRYSSIPVVVAPHNMALGGACELSMHSDKVVAHAETYMGLVEFGVGVIPGGGGTKEFAARASDEFAEGGIQLNVLRNRFLTIGQAKVSTSAHEAFELGYLRKGVDEVVMSRQHQLTRAKEAALQLAENGYSQPLPRKDIHVLGNQGLGLIYVGANSMKSSHYISEHDQKISEKLGYVLCGGDLSSPTKVSETYLLDLERKAFRELCMERKTLERMQSLLRTGKILRN